MPQYQGVWNLAQQAQALTQQQWVTDPLFDQTTLLLQGDGGANGAQNNLFLDTSSNQFAITRNPAAGPNAPTQGSFSPFSSQPGAWSGYFGGSGSYLQGSITMVGGTSVSTFTIEFWYYPTSFSATSPIIGDMQPTGSLNYISAQIDTAGKPALYWWDGSNAQTCTGGTALTLNTWNYVAIRVSSNAISIYVNSATATTVTGTTTLTNRNSGTSYATSYAVGQFTTSQTTSGYVSNIRVSTIARTITVPTTPFTSDANTRILVLQSNRFVDNGVGGSTLTATGVSVQPFSQFAPQFQYTASGTGGSGYFDGTGDWLSIADNAAFAFGANPFTVEFWFYPTLGSTSQYIFDQNPNTASNASFAFLFTSGNVMQTSTFSGTTEYTLNSSALSLNSWYHVAAVRSGANFSLFINGSRVATVGTLSTNSINDSSATVRVGVLGDASNSFPFKGYVSDARIVRGTAVYDPTLTTYTIPTAPLTAITNTQLLCSFTNAGILDGTMKNNLETVGNAQVSTTVVKYGSGSMYFDGTGDYLRAPNSQNIAFGTGDFTIEMWLWFNATPTGDVVVMEARPSNTAVPWIITADATSGGTLYFYDGTTYRSTIPITPQAWMHFAVSRVNGTLRIFNNGVQGFSGTVTTSLNPTGSLVIGARNDGLVPFTGYMDDLRITKGIARYTRNFTPPQVALPRQ